MILKSVPPFDVFWVLDKGVPGELRSANSAALFLVRRLDSVVPMENDGASHW